ncbi:IclR family transcriptional regulator C-terminal domain-containing protein [Phytohabitans flavus]|uniref:IclR family transcriptional regulator domain-containing protein n=1 Tax=Phytohabitans flavus TaxID=1076124 RepID=UPI0031E6B448
MGEPDVRPVRGTATAEDAPTGEFVQSLERGLAVIKAFDTHTELTLSEVARATGLSRGVARRFLHTLVSLGYMSTDGRQFSLRPRVLELGYAYMSNLMLPEIARPHLESLAEKVNEACSITVLEETDVVYVARVPSRHLMGIVINVGTRLPAYATATGRVLLAGLGQAELDEQLTSVRLKRRTERTTVDAGQLRGIVEEVRRVGYCLVDQELEDGVRALAVPIRSSRGSMAGAINIAAPAARRTAQAMVADFLRPLLDAAEAISEDLRRAPH